MLEDTSEKKILSVFTKGGYGIAAMADSIGPGIVGSFFMWFLTDIVGIEPVFAGTITFIAVIWDGITDPLIGHWSDNLRSRFGRRRPFLFVGGILMVVGLMMMFSEMPFENIGLKAYYVVSAMIYYLGYTAFNIPYYAMPGEMSPFVKDRVGLRGFATFFMNVGMLFAGTIPILIAGRFEDNGMTTGDSWHWSITIMAAIAFVSILITVISLKGKEHYETDEPESSDTDENSGIKDFIKSITEVVKIRAYRIIVVASMCFYAVFTIFWAALWYFMTSNLMLSETESAPIYTINIICALVYLSLFMLAMKKFDKKQVLTLALIVGGLSLCIMGIVGVDSYIGCVMIVVVYTFAATAYWTLIYPLFYEIYEADDMRFGKRREGTMFSWFSFMAKVSAAVAIQGLGIALSAANYDGEAVEQVPEALRAILTSTTIVPGVLILLTAVLVIIFPINKKTYAILMKNLELKKAGKEYSTEGLKKIL